VRSSQQETARKEDVRARARSHSVSLSPGHTCCRRSSADGAMMGDLTISARGLIECVVLACAGAARLHLLLQREQMWMCAAAAMGEQRESANADTHSERGWRLLK
jgi:hypothetical protein